MRNEQFMLKDAARAQKLYEIVQKKQEELRLANKKFKALHKKNVNEWAKSIVEQYPNVDFYPSYSGEAICAKFCLANGLHYHLAVNTVGKSTDCYARIASEDLLSQTHEQFMSLADNFKEIFEMYRGQEMMFSSFPHYKYQEVFDCFNKAYAKFIELSAEVQMKLQL